MLKRAPKPKTTRYPTPFDKGASPPKKDSCPAYFAKGGASRVIVLSKLLMVIFFGREQVVGEDELPRKE